MSEQEAFVGRKPLVFLANIYILESPDGKQLAIKINNDVLTIYTASLDNIIKAIQSGIGIEADNIKKPLKDKNFDPVFIDGVFAFYSPSTTTQWYCSTVEMGTIYTNKNKNKSFYMYFLVNSSDIKDVSYIMVCLDHDNMRILLKDLQKYQKELPTRKG